MPLVIAVCLGEPVEVEWKSQKVLTGIFKTPVEGKVKVRRDNYRQADLSVHGGAHKAVYAYPSEHYEFWQSKLEAKLPPGSFGGNLTFRELLEDSVKIGDRFAIALLNSSLVYVFLRGFQVINGLFIVISISVVQGDRLNGDICKRCKFHPPRKRFHAGYSLL